MRIHLLALWAVAVVGLCCAASKADVRYSVTTIYSLPGSTVGYAINSSGQVAGVLGYSNYAGLPGSSGHAMLYDPQTGPHDLGTLGGSISYAYGLNDVGQVVGYSNSGDAFLYSNATGMTDLGAGTAYGINNAGQVTGSGILAGRLATGFGVNSSGHFVGDWSAAGSSLHAAIDGGGAVHDLGALDDSANVSEGFAINALDQAAGYSYTASGSQHAFFYDGSTMRDLGTLGGTKSFGYGINRAGDVVGWSYTPTLVQDAFLYTGGAMLDLNNLIPPDAGIHLSEARGINDSGQIIANGYDSQHLVWVFVLTPTPEPGGGALLLAFVGTTLLRRRRVRVASSIAAD